MQSEVLATIDDRSLRAYVAWVPVLPGDAEERARESRALVTDPRAPHFWDVERALPRVFARLLGLPQDWPAWDVYLAYAPGVRWNDAPPAPAFWHHQLGDGIEAPVLDGATFAAGVRGLVNG
jgi:hypothetical protein